MKARGLPTPPQDAELLAELSKQQRALGMAAPPAAEHEAEPEIVQDESLAYEPLEAPPAEVPKVKARRGIASAHNPYPGKKRATVKTAFNFESAARLEIEAYLHSLGPGMRNLWAERTLLLAVRAAKRRAER